MEIHIQLTASCTCYIQTSPLFLVLLRFLSAPAAEARPGLALTSRCYHPLLESSWHCWEPANATTRHGALSWVSKSQHLTCAFGG